VPDGLREIAVIAEPLIGPEGNHGEVVKEYYFYLDSAHAFVHARPLQNKYPQRAFLYAEVVGEMRSAVGTNRNSS
jgi:hypothetical protein